MLQLLILSSIFYASFAQDNICEKYSKALKKTNKQLVEVIISETVKKIVAPDSSIKIYFDGTKPADSTNFLDPANAAKLVALEESLVRFFGAALQCPDGTIGSYNGRPMAKVHQIMGISVHDFVFFNDQVIGVLNATGVTEIDQVAVRILLNSLKNQIVVQGSICDKYSMALKTSNNALLFLVVNNTVVRVVAEGTITKKYFDGTKPPGSTNFLTNKKALDGLITGLIHFFGGALGCSDGTIPEYKGRKLPAIHGIMGINVNEFNFFNAELIDVLKGYKVESKDLTEVHGVLNSTKAAIVSADKKFYRQ